MIAPKVAVHQPGYMRGTISNDDSWLAKLDAEGDLAWYMACHSSSGSSSHSSSYTESHDDVVQMMAVARDVAQGRLQSRDSALKD